MRGVWANFLTTPTPRGILTPVGRLKCLSVSAIPARLALTARSSLPAHDVHRTTLAAQRCVADRTDPRFLAGAGALCGLCLACAAAADETARHSLAQAEMAPRAAAELGQGIVFLKMPPGRFTESGKLDVFRRHYPSLDRQPTPRPAYGMYLLKSPIEKGEVVPLIERDAEIAFVADPEVSYDGTKILFSLLKHNENWFHIHEMNADGTGRRQLTFGEADDVSPAYLPDGRIVFCSSRCGYRDEYHGQPVENLHVMDADG